MSASESRRTKRRHLIYYLRVFDATTGEVLGHLVDLTPEGLMTISEEPIETGLTFHLEIQWPTESGATETTAFTAKTKWCRPDVNPDFHDTGFELTGATVESLAKIQTLIHELGFQN